MNNDELLLAIIPDQLNQHPTRIKFYSSCHRIKCVQGLSELGTLDFKQSIEAGIGNLTKSCNFVDFNNYIFGQN